MESRLHFGLDRAGLPCRSFWPGDDLMAQRQSGPRPALHAGPAPDANRFHSQSNLDRHAVQIAGENAKRRALSLLEQQRAMMILRARRVLLAALLAGDTISTDNVRESVPLPPGVNPKLFGAVPSALAELKIIAP